MSTAVSQLPIPKHRRALATHPAALRPYLPASSPTTGTINVDTTASHVLNQFEPALALGAAVDAVGVGGVPSLFSTSNLSKMLTAGEGGLSYRLYTELNNQNWHWNPSGTWSDAAHKSGYFIGSSTLGSAIDHSYGFYLTHRGNTLDPGSNLQYSQIDDGDPSTYWKSNPYLTSTYTKQADSNHPQWIFVDLGSVKNVNAVRIQWANPYAVSYAVQYWTGDDPLYDPAYGSWVTYPSGAVTNGVGGAVTLKVAPSGVATQFVRILMTVSSRTYDSHGTSDPRNAMGYAIYEIGVGSESPSGVFTDYVVHSADQNQTPIYVSSTDPWHESTGQSTATEQVGLDYIEQSRLSQRLPAMLPVPMLYSTPENAVAEIAYLMHRQYPIVGIELGEEPDGQFVTPEDYGALYIQWAAAIHAAFPQLKLGGPVTSVSGVQTWVDASGNVGFLERFVAYLTAHNALQLLNFVSTEHYPFYPTSLDWSMVPQEVEQVDSLFNDMTNARVPKNVSLYVTEYNLSGAPAEPIVDLLGALWHAVFIGEFMKKGGAGSYFYQYFPFEVSSGGASYGLIGMFTATPSDQIAASTSQYFSSQLICQQWCEPGKGLHSVLPATSTITDSTGNEVVLPYAVSRPDGQYALLLVNTDTTAHTVSVAFGSKPLHYFTGTVTQAQFSPKDYSWLSNAANGSPKPDGPIELKSVSSGSSTTYSLPAHSITVLRGKIK